MATSTTTTMTRKEALAIAIESVKDNAMAVETLTKMLNGILKEGSRASAPTERQIENDGIRSWLIANMPSVPTLSADITAMIPTSLSKEAITSNRVVAILTQLKNDGVVVKTEDKVDGKGKVKAFYAKAVSLEG